MSRLSTVEWRYLRRGKVAHALRRSADAVAVCGVWCGFFGDWYGTGNQVEYERTEALPTCLHCAVRLGMEEE